MAYDLLKELFTIFWGLFALNNRKLNFILTFIADKFSSKYVYCGVSKIKLLSTKVTHRKHFLFDVILASTSFYKTKQNQKKMDKSKN